MAMTVLCVSCGRKHGNSAFGLPVNAIGCTGACLHWAIHAIDNPPFYTGHLRCVCRYIRDDANRYAVPQVMQTRAARPVRLRECFPTFRRDREIYGEPCEVWPIPMWRIWRVQEWWYVLATRGLWEITAWHLAETHWIRNLHDLEPLITYTQNIGGLFQLRRFYLSSYVWEYDLWETPQWLEEDHI